MSRASIIHAHLSSSAPLSRASLLHAHRLSSAPIFERTFCRVSGEAIREPAFVSQLAAKNPSLGGNQLQSPWIQSHNVDVHRAARSGRLQWERSDPTARGGRSGGTIGSRSLIRSALTCRLEASSPAITALSTSSIARRNLRQQVFRVFPRFRARGSRHRLDGQATVTTIVSLGFTRTIAAQVIRAWNCTCREV